MAVAIESRIFACPCGAKQVLHVSPYGPFYRCETYPRCDYKVSANKDPAFWGDPLGIPALAETRTLRVEAHKAFDPIWRAREGNNNRTRARAAAYEWLAGQMGLPEDECHIAKFDADQCKKVTEVCT